MPICDICGEEVVSEADMRTHLLLSHLEMSCPFCSLSGVSYDELSFHINSAHTETDGHTGPTVECSGTDKRLERTADCSTGKSENSVCVLGDTRLNDRYTQGTRTTEELAGPKQKRLYSPAKEKHSACPMCNLVCSDSFVLQEHVELHLQEEGMGEGAVNTINHDLYGVRCYVCPICSLGCSDSSSLQEHVELHLESSANGAEGFCSDLTLARQLQQEEEQKRKEEEAKREAEEFKKLQRQFGLDGRGGYRQQMERNMERAVSRGHMGPAEFHRKRAEMMESLASGVDDGETKSSGLMEALYDYFRRDARDAAQVWLCAETDHHSSSDGDKGWGCGYRNFQMLLSCLLRMETYKNHLSVSDIPSIPRVQSLIEEAWKEGMDPQGSSHFNNRLQGTRAWIGATEVYALLTSLGVNARIVDFHRPTGQGNTHPRLFEWVKQYFSLSAVRNARLPPKVVQTPQPPIYLQHQGHSRSIIGVEQKKNGRLCLLLFDPGCPAGDMVKLLSQDTVGTLVQRMRKFPTQMKHEQYQLVAVESVLTPEQKQSRILNSRTFCAERIP
uniref:Zinc finger-containing ubiquitin peptidase 1 n=1 Tax=Denticeps clupeoides TaxID=299321 RepID=A0AAY4AKB4_9TELE